MADAESVSVASVDALKVLLFENRRELGRAAARQVACAIQARLERAPQVRIVFAAAPSQDEFLSELVARFDIPWSRVIAYHMDEYLGLDANHTASFRRYLREHLFEPANLSASQTRLIEGESSEVHRVCYDYEQLLRRDPPDIVCAGIGENGHLAFNDPPVADFLDPVWVKVVRLDQSCRAQQVNDGCFRQIDEVPTHAITLTIPALLSAPVVSVVVPGPRKADAVKAALEGPVDETCPASILRRKPGAMLLLDQDSAGELSLFL